MKISKMKKKNWISEMLRLYYNHPYHALIKAEEAKALSEINFSPPVLDLGCGDGTFSSTLFRVVEIGLDSQKREIEKAKKTGVHNKLIVGDACNLPFRNESFATVGAFCTMEHIPNIDKALKEISRVLRIGGEFIFTVPSDKFDDNLFFVFFMNKLRLKLIADYYRKFKDEEMRHYHLCDSTKWIGKLRKVGLNLIEARSYCSKTRVQIASLLDDIYLFLFKLKLFSFVVKIPKRIQFSIFNRFFSRYCSKGFNFEDHCHDIERGCLLIRALKS